MGNAMGTALTGDSTAILGRRQACSPLNHNDALAIVPDTAEAFRAYPYFGDIASGVVDPSGFESVFTNASAAARSSGYIKYVKLDTYDVSACAQQCEAAHGCEAFNIFFQRSPSVKPATDCPNPSANTLVACGLYSRPLNATDIVYKGQTRGPVDGNGQVFEVVIRGSNVYNRIAKMSLPSANETVTMSTSEPGETSTVLVEMPSTDTIASASTSLTSTPLSLFQPSGAPEKPSAERIKSIQWITSIKTVYLSASTSFDPINVISPTPTSTTTTTIYTRTELVIIVPMSIAMPV